jgi:ubiquinone/menaquinone biosynthesis C-methylase UbiE
MTMSLPSYAMNQTSFPEMYERWLVGPLFRPWAEATVEELGLSNSDRVLDIACGTGIVARVAQPRVACAVGIDVSAGMLAVARAAAPGIDWREGNASALPLRPQEQFDVVVCHQGLQFFADKPAAAAQMRLALAPEGKLAVAIWRSDDEMPFVRELRRVAERHLGPIDDQRYNFGDAGALEALLRGAGLREVRSKILSRTLRFKDGASFLRLNAMAFVGMSAVGKAMDEQERSRIVEVIANDSADVARSHTEGSDLAFEMRTNLATARG